MEDSIIVDLKETYGLTCNQITPVSGGWLNQKWKVSTDKCDYLVKPLSRRRMARPSHGLIVGQGTPSFSRIICRCNANSTCCNFSLLCRFLLNDIAYMVMDFCSGKIESPSTITTIQMHSLGSACGLMHKALLQIPTNSVKGFPINNRQVISSLWTNYYTRRQECSSSCPIEYRKALLMQEPILKQLTNEFFDKLPKGIAHEDFSSDNILFDIDCVSAIIDFDRNHYSFMWHDIGRAILSFALNDNKLKIENIDAFREGYSQHIELTMPNIADAFRLTWCIEIPWWIQLEFFAEKCHDKIERFKAEMFWLSEHWLELDSLLSSY